ncbi:ankyrin repeat-containing protein BDA1 [Eucalyptus grandis]|uniref:ankyrin repeat-containing protein BDA1 n=1 Tax=Eucalyptus grandis TaxID=71139 RepID=UPI00192EF729|nr:ankyrin repeat-containing protein BDA1 [Eucalyptus grandis]
MEQRLLEAARKGNIEELNDLIRSNGLILEEMALEGAGHTPLHVACVAGHMDFVQELLKLMPKFAEKVNADGFSPLHITAARGDVEITRELLKVGQHLCSVKGRERRIPLHYAVINGELDVMKVLLSTSPDSVEETTARKEMALHLAVKNNRFDVVVVLVEHLKKYNKEKVINWKDHEGNTVLHLAAASKNFEVVKFILHGTGLKYKVVKVNALNESGLTPLDVLTLSQMGEGDREMREILVRAGARHGKGISDRPASSGLVSADEDASEGDNSPRSDGEPVRDAPQSATVPTPCRNLNRNGSLDVRNVLLVVAALIASATYQAVLQPPSYKIKVDDSYKKSIFGYRGFNRNSGYIVFMSFNTFGFLVSVQTIISLTRDLPVRLPLLLSTFSMVLTYATFMGYVPFSSMDKALTLKNEALFYTLPISISILLLLTQNWLALILDLILAIVSKRNIVGDMYNLWAKPESQTIQRRVAKMKTHRMHLVRVLGKILEKVLELLA